MIEKKVLVGRVGGDFFEEETEVISEKIMGKTKFKIISFRGETRLGGNIKISLDFMSLPRSEGSKGIVLDFSLEYQQEIGGEEE